MQIVINVPEESYEFAKECKSKGSSKHSWNLSHDKIVLMIANGTPLPKGHGKLVDVNSIPEEDKDITVKGLLHPGTIAYAGAINLEQYINGLPTIIEADKRESEN